MHTVNFVFEKPKGIIKNILIIYLYDPHYAMHYNQVLTETPFIYIVNFYAILV